jgi:hypothetical protein
MIRSSRAVRDPVARAVRRRHARLPGFVGESSPEPNRPGATASAGRALAPPAPRRHFSLACPRAVDGIVRAVPPPQLEGDRPVSHFAHTALWVLLALLVAPTDVSAIDKCKVKVDKRTGVINVDASPVGGPLAWGAASGSENNAFFNDATCNVGGKAKKCQLANPATLAAKTPPPGCTLYLNDGVAPCSAWIPGCSPGARSDAGALVKDANGLLLGTTLDPNGQSALRNEGGTLVRLAIAYDGSGFVTFGGFLFASANCSGTPLLGADPAMVKQVNAIGTTGYYAPVATSTQSFSSNLQIAGTLYASQTDCDNNFGVGFSTHVPPYGCCLAAGGSGPLGTAQSIDLSSFTPPFKVELQ